MTLRLPTPRLLPLTIAMLAAVLASRSVWLVRSAITGDPPSLLVAAAWAGAHDAPAEPKPVAGPAGHETHKGAAAPEPAPAPAVETPLPGSPPISDSEKAVLMDLRQRRQELDAREAGLSSREAILGAAEAKLSTRVGELQRLQDRLESLDSSHRQQEDAAWQGLVKTYETMKPRDAAAIFNDLAMPVLLSVMGRMKEAKAAAVLAAMSPDKAREVTTQLAFARTRAADAVQGGENAPKLPAPAADAPKPPGSGT